MITAQELIPNVKRNMSGMDLPTLIQNKDEISAYFHVMGMYDLAKETSAKPNSGTISRIFQSFGADMFGSVAIEELTPREIEFECIYGLNDPETGEQGKEISFVVRDKKGRFPVNLNKEQIITEFAINIETNSVICEVVSCRPDISSQGTAVKLLVNIGEEAFFSEGEFIMTIEARMAGLASARASVRFIVRNTVPTFFREKYTRDSLPSLKRALPKVSNKPILPVRSIIQTRQKNTRIPFEKRQGEGIPEALCSNSAFKVAAISAQSMTISFKIPSYLTLERKLSQNSSVAKLAPETSVWVEWDDCIMIYNVKYKGFLMER